MTSACRVLASICVALATEYGAMSAAQQSETKPSTDSSQAEAPKTSPKSARERVPSAEDTKARNEKVEFVDWGQGARPISMLQTNSNALASTLMTKSPSSAKTIRSIQESTDFLNHAWQGDRELAPIPTFYLESLQAQAELLGDLSSKNPSSPETAAVLNDISEDLEIKVSHCKASSKGWASLVDVKIKTLRGTTVISGLEVWYVPRGWADVQERWMRCSNLSSPAIARQLPPGKYMIRSAMGSAVPVKVGGDGKDEQEIELSVE